MDFDVSAIVKMSFSLPDIKLEVQPEHERFYVSAPSKTVTLSPQNHIHFKVKVHAVVTATNEDETLKLFKEKISDGWYVTTRISVDINIKPEIVLEEIAVTKMD